VTLALKFLTIFFLIADGYAIYNIIWSVCLSIKSIRAIPVEFFTCPIIWVGCLFILQISQKCFWGKNQGIQKGEVSLYHWPPAWLVWNQLTTDNFCFYLLHRLVQTSQTGGQWYSDTSPFSIPWKNTQFNFVPESAIFEISCLKIANRFLSDLCKATTTPCSQAEQFSKFRTVSGRCNNVQVSKI
jgi:hypothetical protein